MTELKSCPFCGGQPTAIETHMGRGELYCGTCDVVMGGNEAKTPEELTEAWNTRAERTCRIRGGECDQCGAIIHERANMYWVPVEDGMRTVEHHDVRYCPNCGRKVER